MGIADATTTWDTVLERMVAAATDTIESMAGDRRFKSATYTSEVYSGEDGQKTMVLLRHFPVTTLTSAYYRAGDPETPNWTAFDATEYELINDKEPRRVRIYSKVPAGQNNLRFTYVAGYLIDFANDTDVTKHTLPFDVSDLCERMVISKWKQRESEGKINEAGAEASVSWRDGLSKDDVELIRGLNPPLFA